MLFGMDTGIIGGVLKLDPFRNKYNLPLASENPTLSANLEANIVSTLQAGCFLGAIVAGWVADKLGRRIGMMIAALFAIIGSVMQAAAAGHFPVMYIGRFVAGVGVGGASMITPLYTSENAPRAIRGALTGMYQFFIVTGGQFTKHGYGHGIDRIQCASPSGSTTARCFTPPAQSNTSYRSRFKLSQPSSCLWACSSALRRHVGWLAKIVGRMQASYSRAFAIYHKHTHTFRTNCRRCPTSWHTNAA